MDKTNWKENDLKKYKYIKGYPFKSSLYLPGGSRVIRVSDITPEGFNNSNKIYIKYVDDYSNWILEPNDIVVTTVGSKPPMYNSIVGMPLLITEKNCGDLLNQNNVVIKVGDKSQARIIYENMLTKSYLNYITQIFRGNANQANIAVSDLVNFKYKIPDNPEELDSLACKFENIDSLIYNLNILLIKKKNIKFGLMQKLLDDSRYIDKNIDGWKNVRLGDICNVFAGGTPSTFNNNYWNGNINWLASGAIQNNIIKEIDVKQKITVEGLNNSSAKMIKPNSILIAMTGATCGNVGFLPFASCGNQSVMALEPYCDDPKFLYYMLIYNKSNILKYQAGGAQAGINKKSCCNLEFKIPVDVNEQIKISNILTNIDIEIEKLANKLEKYKKVKKGMLEELL